MALASLVWWRPYLVVRSLASAFVRVFYRLHVYGRENIPERGPALLVCNHVSYIDFLLLCVAQPRFIRFVFFAGWTKVLFIRRLLRWGRAIPIDATSGPKAILKSLRSAGEALNENDLVCIFAEGRFTRTGFLLPFHRGFEQIVKNNQAPIIPICLDELWGSIFSFYGDRTLWKLPRRIPYPTSVAFGKPVPATSTAAEVRQVVQQLAADCAVARSNRCRTIPREFIRTAARHPFRQCIIEARSADSHKYYNVLARAIDLSRRLSPMRPDASIVATFLPPGVHSVIANLAIAFCDKAVLNLDPEASPESIRAKLAECRVTRLLTTARYLIAHPLPAALGVELIDIERALDDVPSFRRFITSLAAVVLPGWLLDHWVLHRGGQKLDDLAAIVYTRGRTGPPKPVMLSHRNLVASVSALVKILDPLPRDRLLATLPVSDCTGFVCTLWAPLAVGASGVIAPSSPSPRGEGRGEGDAAHLAQTCRQHHCTVMLATPEFLKDCLVSCQPDDFHTLHTLVSVGAKLPETLAADFAERFGVKPLEAYDCAELSSIIATNVRDKTLEGFTQVGQKSGTVGQPLPGIACRIVDPATLAPLPPGQAGTLLVTGPTVMLGYLGCDELTASTLSTTAGSTPATARRWMRTDLSASLSPPMSRRKPT